MEKIIISLKDGNVKEFDIPVESNVHGQFKKRNKAYTLVLARSLLEKDLTVIDDNITLLDKLNNYISENENNLDIISWSVNDYTKTIPINRSSYIEYSIDSLSGEYKEGVEALTFSTIIESALDSIKVV